MQNSVSFSPCVVLTANYHLSPEPLCTISPLELRHNNGGDEGSEGRTREWGMVLKTHFLRTRQHHGATTWPLKYHLTDVPRCQLRLGPAFVRLHST